MSNNFFNTGSYALTVPILREWLYRVVGDINFFESNFKLAYPSWYADFGITNPKRVDTNDNRSVEEKISDYIWADSAYYDKYTMANIVRLNKENLVTLHREKYDFDNLPAIRSNITYLSNISRDWYYVKLFLNEFNFRLNNLDIFDKRTRLFLLDLIKEKIYPAYINSLDILKENKNSDIVMHYIPQPFKSERILNKYGINRKHTLDLDIQYMWSRLRTIRYSQYDIAKSDGLFSFANTSQNYTITSNVETKVKPKETVNPDSNTVPLPFRDKGAVDNLVYVGAYKRNKFSDLKTDTVDKGYKDLAHSEPNEYGITKKSIVDNPPHLEGDTLVNTYKEYTLEIKYSKSAEREPLFTNKITIDNISLMMSNISPILVYGIDSRYYYLQSTNEKIQKIKENINGEDYKYDKYNMYVDIPAKIDVLKGVLEHEND